MSRIYRHVDGRGCGQWMEGSIKLIVALSGPMDGPLGPSMMANIVRSRKFHCSTKQQLGLVAVKWVLFYKENRLVVEILVTLY